MTSCRLMILSADRHHLTNQLTRVGWSADANQVGWSASGRDRASLLSAKGQL